MTHRQPPGLSPLGVQGAVAMGCDGGERSPAANGGTHQGSVLSMDRRDEDG